MTQILQVAAIALATVGTGAATVTFMNGDIPDLAIPEGDWSSGSELDGKSVQITTTDVDSGRVVEDVLLFRDGTFQSVNCQEYCEFGWAEYQTKVVDGTVYFTTQTKCSEAPHTVVWYGALTGDDAHIDATWTTRRWYWTHQIKVSAGASDISLIEESPSG